MASRISSLKALLPEFESALQQFTSSSSRFHVVRTINPTSTTPRTLYILDSSFNPPSLAHLSLATSALTNHAPSEPAPYRFLLLFSTHNADKAPSPASFAQRVALMTAFAQDLSTTLQNRKPELPDEVRNVSIDIGLIKEPYYTDKSIAIAESKVYAETDALQPKHVHLVGFDTLIRFCNAKYYPSYSPPLSALSPFFSAGHKLHVTLRPADASDASSSEYGSIEDQEAYVRDLAEGGKAADGFEKSWAQSIYCEGAGERKGISSTRVRQAAQSDDWEEVGNLCTQGVREWIREMGMYREDVSGK